MYSRHRFFRYLLWFLTLGLWAVSALRAEAPFSYAATGQPGPNWREAWECGFDWELRDSALCNEQGLQPFALLKASPFGRRVQIETTLTVNRPVGQGWKVAGIVIYFDKKNFWRLALVDSWDSKQRYAELWEMRGGVWQANRDLQVLGAKEPPPFQWEYGQAYRLSLDLKAGEIRGTVRDADGKLLWQTGYRLTEKAVGQGIPGLCDTKFSVAFREFKATVADVAAGPAKAELPPYERATPVGAIGKKTGFFHVEKIDGRWLVIDPAGQEFYIIATDYVDNKRWFCEKLGYVPYERNVAKKFPSTEAWAESAVSRLKEWGFNSLGIDCAPGVHYKGLPHTVFLNVGCDFCRQGEPFRIAFGKNGQATPCSYFPNVFHPRFEEFSRMKAENICAANRNDPWLLGYFIDNELAWWGKPEHRDACAFGLFEACMEKPAGHSAKQGVIDWLRRRYATVQRLNAEWGTDLASFDQLPEKTVLNGSKPKAVAAAKTDFARFVADRYFAITTAAIRKADPNHMILGCRFAGLFPLSYQPAWEACGRYCDIVSVNVYENVNQRTGEVYAEIKGERLPLGQEFRRISALACNKPLWVTEWSYMAYDSGLPNEHGAGQLVDTQEEKAFAFTAFQKLLFGLPCVVGSSYFQWHDQPAEGMSSWFAENGNYGLVDQEDEAWEEVTRAAARVNRKAGDIHRGQTAELSVTAEPNGAFRVANAGKEPADCLARLWLDGRAEEQRLVLAPGETRIVKPSAFPQGGGAHYLQCKAENAGEAFEVNLTDNSADQVVFTPEEKTVDLPDAKRLATVAVYNPTDRTLPCAYLTLGQAELPFKLNAPENRDRVAAAESGADGKAVFLPTQVDCFTDGAELVVKVPELAPHGVRTLFLCRRNQPQKTDANAAFKLTRTPEAFALDSGRLKASRQTGSENLFDRVELDGKELGRFFPLIHEALPQEQWVAPDKLDSIEAVSGPLRLTLDAVMTRENRSTEVITKLSTDGKREEPRQTPARYSIGVRLYFYPGENWFAARTLWVKNIDVRPWKLRAYFHFAPSNLAGSAKNDRPYQTGYWEDKDAGLCYGAVDPSGTFTLLFFTEGGKQHPDARRAVNQELKPGETWRAPQPCLYLVGVNTPRDGQWKPIQTGIIASDQVGHRISVRP